MSKLFWVRRYVVVAALMFVILMASVAIKGGSLPGMVLENLFWSTLSAAVFVSFRYYQASKGVACAL